MNDWNGDELHTIDVNHNKTKHPATRSTVEYEEETEYEEQDHEPKRPRKSQKKRKKTNPALVAGVVVCGILLLGLVVIVVFYNYVEGKFGLLNHETAATLAEGESMTLRTIEDATRETNLAEEETTPGEDTVDEAMAALVAADAETFYKTGKPATADYVKNILLIGIDNRGNESQDTWLGNSDSMIMVSINSKTHKIILTSFMRDMYVYIPGLDGCDKLNSAHARGGSDFLCEEISNMFKVKVDQYARVDFYNLIDIVDAAGGIDMYVSEEERSVLNMYIYYMCIEAAEPIANPESYYLQKSGNVHLTGMQAVGYARIRYVGNADYERTERQRKVISALSDNLRSMNLVQIDAFANSVLPLVWTNMSHDDLWPYVTNALTYLGYEIVSQRVPFPDTSHSEIINGMDCLIPDYKTNAEMLIESIYGE